MGVIESMTLDCGEQPSYNHPGVLAGVLIVAAATTVGGVAYSMAGVT